MTGTNPHFSQVFGCRDVAQALMPALGFCNLEKCSCAGAHNGG
ncbi:hypothetical protein SBA4_1670006 [Candidatus Sulfopaludibacter sp. SbA4]|nr:hypothetical protein SBA4_1670006 [Candidatus Sulfopaludibacter sp. SbA4]